MQKGGYVVKVLLIASLMMLTLDARENPFFPSEGEKDIPLTSNEEKVIPPLQRASITLPPEARVIQNVTISYKNLDGSIDSRSVSLENAVDWHLPVFISQSYESTPQEPTKEQTPKKSVVNKPKVDEKSVKKESEYKEVASMDFAKFYASKTSLKIATTDKMLRNFLLVQPHRIVVDFQRDSSMKSYIIKIADSEFTKIRIGNHDGYYRVVIELDGYYKYSVKNVDGEYIFKLR